MPRTFANLLKRNRLWAEKLKAGDPELAESLARDQQPEVLWIGCSDSRVPANEIMGLEPGDVFVHRNIANVVDNIDLNCQSVIEYAVKYLGVKHIVVCGHYGCGGVNAAMQQADLGLLNGWLRNVRDVYRIHAAELNAIPNETERYNRLVELNVQEQCINVIKTAVVQKTFKDTGNPTVHGWVYDLKNGILKDLNIDFPRILKGIQEIYNLD